VAKAAAVADISAAGVSAGAVGYGYAAEILLKAAKRGAYKAAGVSAHLRYVCDCIAEIIAWRRWLASAAAEMLAWLINVARRGLAQMFGAEM
jgi:hypothetical protein